MNIKEIISISLILFSVIDIIGSLPIIIDMQSKGQKIESAKASLIALLIMTVFLYAGESLLGLFGVDVQSFAVAGAIIIFLLGMEMVLGVNIFKESPNTSTGSIVPIAFPLIAGAGTMTTILSLKANYATVNIQMGIILNILFVYIILRSSKWIESKIGENGTDVLRKVFGIILLAIAIKLFKEHFHLVVDCKK